MGAFCVFGISKSLCKDKAAKKTPTNIPVGDGKTRRELTPLEWAQRRDELAASLFAEIDRPTKISPEFDAPQFCRDWLRVSPAEVRMARIMCRRPKTDEKGNTVLRKGVPVMAWAEYSGAPT